MSTMQTIVNRNLLKYACSTAMFCGCDRILDSRRAVLITLPSGKTITACTKCFDAVADKLPAGADIVDARKL